MQYDLLPHKICLLILAHECRFIASFSVLYVTDMSQVGMKKMFEFMYCLLRQHYIQFCNHVQTPTYSDNKNVGYRGK